MTTQTSLTTRAVHGQSLIVGDVHGGPHVAQMLARAQAMQEQNQAERQARLVETVETRNRIVGSYC